MIPVFILIRTSGRPKFFNIMLESIRNQTYPNIITIVHTDDPEDDYVTGDIIIKGERLSKELGTAPYNLYNNTLLKSIPDEPGYFWFLDDDDMLEADDSIEKFVSQCKKTYCNVARVRRWGDTIFPRNFGQQNSFQTECFMIHTDYKDLGTWWANKGGDHYYSKQITAKLPINWIDNLIVAKAQDGKGHGRRLDLGVQFDKEDSCKDNKQVPVLYLNRVISPQTARGRTGEVKMVIYRRAKMLENKGHVRILPEDLYKKFIQSGRDMNIIYSEFTQ